MVLEYVLITPARNEAAYIEGTIEAVIAQTMLPTRWIIVSDGSTDGTDSIVERYAVGRSWMQLIRLPDVRDRSFAAKVQAFNVGYALLGDLAFDVVGCLDADITFERDYFEYLMERFGADLSLGVAGTHYIEGNFHSYLDSNISVCHVNGGVQLFRRKCFEEIGGYTPIRRGGVDWVAVTTARMRGWKTYSFGERVFYHHRKIGTADSNELVSRFKYGMKDYFLGGHPVWQLFRGLYQLGKRPYVLGGLFLLSGYVWCWITCCERPIPKELVLFHRSEQMARLRQLLKQRISLAKRGARSQGV